MDIVVQSEAATTTKGRELYLEENIKQISQSQSSELNYKLNLPLCYLVLEIILLL